MSAGLVLMLALLAEPAVASPVPGPEVATAADAASSVLSGDLMVRKGNGCSPIEGAAPVPNLRGDAGPVRFERKLWLNLREDINSGVIRVERQGNHLRAFVQYRVEDLPSDRPVPTCLYEAELTLLVWGLPPGNYELEFIKAPPVAAAAVPTKKDR